MNRGPDEVRAAAGVAHAAADRGRIRT